MQALTAWARLDLARGDVDLAAATIRRGLRVTGDDRVRAASLFIALVEAELGRNDDAAAARASADLDARTEGLCDRVAVISTPVSPPFEATTTPRQQDPARPRMRFKGERGEGDIPRSLAGLRSRIGTLGSEGSPRGRPPPSFPVAPNPQPACITGLDNGDPHVGAQMAGGGGCSFGRPRGLRPIGPAPRRHPGGRRALSHAAGAFRDGAGRQRLGRAKPPRRSGPRSASCRPTWPSCTVPRQPR